MKTLKDNVAEILSKVPSLDGKFAVTYVSQGPVKFEIELRTESGTTLTFEMMDDLSQTFSTKKINFTSVASGDRGCDSCGYVGVEGYSEVTLMEATI